MAENKPGRPKGTTKNGELSPKKKMDRLRTRAWAKECSLYIGDEEPNTYRLQQESAKALKEAYPSEIKTKKGKTILIDDDIIDATRWNRWLSGKLSCTQPGGVRRIWNYTDENKKELIKEFNRSMLWPETQPVFYIGPWASGDDGCPGSGGFVPLWASIQAQNPSDLFNAWLSIPLSVWESWAPLNDFDDDSHEYPGLDQSYVFLERQNIHQLFLFLRHIVQIKKFVPPLLALSASISISRLSGNKTLWLFSPQTGRDPLAGENEICISLPPKSRNSVINSLNDANLTLEDIIDAAHSYGLNIFDCGSMSYQQYRDLRWPTPTFGLYERRMITKLIEEDWEEVEIDEDDWRDFFAPPYPRE